MWLAMNGRRQLVMIESGSVMECKNCTADLPLTPSGKYSGLCETCTALYRKQDEKDKNRRSVYESNLSFFGAVVFILLGLYVIIYDPSAPAVGSLFMIGLFLALGSLGAGIVLCLIGIAFAYYGIYIKRGGTPLRLFER